jgi:hypothetical protein
MTIKGLVFEIVECDRTFFIRAKRPPCPLLTEDGQWAYAFGDLQFHSWPTRHAAEVAAWRFSDDGPPADYVI